MTTIACSRTEIACDSRTSFDTGEYFDCDDKIERIGEDLVGAAGSVEDIFKWLEWFKDKTKEKPAFEGDEKPEVLVLNKRGIFYYSGGSCYPVKIIAPFFAIGNGSMAARVAMECGKSPAEALEIVKKYDKHTGGKVRVFKL